MAQPGTDSPPQPPPPDSYQMSQIIGQSGEVGGEIPREKDLSLVLLRHIYKQGLLRQTRCLCPGALGRENWPGDPTDPQVAGQGVRKK